jgi:hypothetical protein
VEEEDVLQLSASPPPPAEAEQEKPVETGAAPEAEDWWTGEVEAPAQPQRQVLKLKASQAAPEEALEPEAGAGPSSPEESEDWWTTEAGASAPPPAEEEDESKGKQQEQ